MMNAEAVSFLYCRFGTDVFRVADLNDDEVNRLLGLLRLRVSRNRIGNRSRLGSALADAGTGALFITESMGYEFLIEARRTDEGALTGRYWVGFWDC